MKRFIAVAGVLASLASTACVTQQTPKPSTLTGFRTELVTPARKSFEKEVYLGAEQAPMGTIAFSPPEACRGISTFGQVAGPGSTNGNAELIASSCGVLMTLLEEGAARRGYRVVSWRNLVGQQRPIDYAAQANVDGLVEINELSIIDEAIRLGPGLERFAVYEKHGDRLVPRDDYARDPALQQRCLAAWPQPFQLPAFAIDAKLTTVHDGRLRATYRNTAVMYKGDTVTETRATWAQDSPLATTTQTFDNAARWNDMLSSVAMVGVGGVAALVALWLYGNNPFPDIDAEIVAMVPGIIGAALVIAGGVLLFTALGEPSDVSFTVASDAPEPICQERFGSVELLPRTVEDAKAALRSVSSDLLEAILPPPAPPPARP